MNTHSSPLRPQPRATASFVVVLSVLISFPAVLHAQSKPKNPASKVYVTDVSGEAIIDTGEAVDDLTKRSVYTVQGAVIETRAPDSPADTTKHFSTMVYSNGTGAFFDADTRVEVKRFLQEPFTPNRNDAEVEPSISQTQAFLARGTVGLCNSKLVAGSNMTYLTPNGTIKIRGRKLVMEATADMTKVSMLEGESTIQAGPLDSGGHIVKVGEQAIIRRNSQGQTTQVEIRRIPPEEMPRLDDQVAMACMARKSVYFDVRERRVDTLDSSGTSNVGDLAAGAGAGDGTTSGTSFSRVNAFDGSAGGTGNTIREFVPIEILPTTLPVEFTVSASSIISGQRR